MLNLLLILASLSQTASSLFMGSDDPKPVPQPAPKSPPSLEERFQHPEGVAWIGTWEAAKAEAARTGKPILLLSAAPQCRGIPGVW